MEKYGPLDGRKITRKRQPNGAIHIKQTLQQQKEGKNLFILQIISTANCHVTVHGPETLVWDDACVGSAHPACFLTRVDIVGAKIGQTCNLINKINRLSCMLK